MPSRRTALALFGGFAVAGCAGRRRTTTQSTTGTPTATDSPTDTPQLSFGEADADGVRPLETRVDSSYRRIKATDHNAIVDGDVWHLFVTIERKRGDPRPRSFRVMTADGVYRPLVVRNDASYRRKLLSLENDPYGDANPGWLSFAVPYDDPCRDVVLERPETTWLLPSSAVDRLRAEPPAFELLSVSTPDQAPADEPFDATVTVRNDGGRGVFRGAFNFRQPIYIPSGVSWSVEAGTTTSLQATIDVHSGYVTSDPGDTVEGRFVSAGGPAEFAVDLT